MSKAKIALNTGIAVVYDGDDVYGLKIGKPEPENISGMNIAVLLQMGGPYINLLAGPYPYKKVYDIMSLECPAFRIVKKVLDARGLADEYKIERSLCKSDVMVLAAEASREILALALERLCDKEYRPRVLANERD
ncbi:hypothetical protein HZC00_01260 [Candidatus Kaiserbacteria bacterium]|nr:hypothetical protein [Candidatus Kaiserbacteria bacterium]